LFAFPPPLLVALILGRRPEMRDPQGGGPVLGIFYVLCALKARGGL
jgi:hypothetical protein